MAENIGFEPMLLLHRTLFSKQAHYPLCQSSNGGIGELQTLTPYRYDYWQFSRLLPYQLGLLFQLPPKSATWKENKLEV